MNEFIKKRWADRVLAEDAWGVTQLFDGEKLSPFGILCEIMGEKIERGYQVAWQCQKETVIPPESVCDRLGVSFKQTQDFQEFYMYESTGAQDVANYIEEVFNG